MTGHAESKKARLRAFLSSSASMSLSDEGLLPRFAQGDHIVDLFPSSVDRLESHSHRRLNGALDTAEPAIIERSCLHADEHGTSVFDICVANLLDAISDRGSGAVQQVNVTFRYDDERSCTCAHAAGALGAQSHNAGAERRFCRVDPPEHSIGAGG